MQNQSIILCFFSIFSSFRKLVRLCMVGWIFWRVRVGFSRLRGGYQDWRCFAGCRCKTKGKTSKRVCLCQRPGLESGTPSAEAKNDRRPLCWDPSGRSLSRSGNYWVVAHPFVCNGSLCSFALGLWTMQTSDSRSHWWETLIYTPGSEGALTTFHGRSWMFA